MSEFELDISDYDITPILGFFREASIYPNENLQAQIYAAESQNERVLCVLMDIFAYRLNENSMDLVKLVVSRGELFGLEFGLTGLSREEEIDAFVDEIWEFLFLAANDGEMVEVGSEDSEYIESPLESYIDFLENSYRRYSEEEYRSIYRFVRTCTPNKILNLANLYNRHLAEYGVNNHARIYSPDSDSRAAAQLSICMTQYKKSREDLIKAMYNEISLQEFTKLYNNYFGLFQDILTLIFNLEYAEAERITTLVIELGLDISIGEMASFAKQLELLGLDVDIPDEAVIVDSDGYMAALKMLGYDENTGFTQIELYEDTVIDQFLGTIDLNDIKEGSYIEGLVDEVGMDEVFNMILGIRRYLLFRDISMQRGMDKIKIKAISLEDEEGDDDDGGEKVYSEN